MAIRATGYRLNNKELKKKLDLFVEKEANRWVAAGSKANKELRKEATISWFLGGTNYHSENYSTTLEATIFDNPIIESSGHQVVITYKSYIDLDKYQSIKISKNNSSIFKNKYKDMDKYYKNRAGFIVYQQWNKGILALPEHREYKYEKEYGEWNNKWFYSGATMQSFVQKEFSKNWESRVNSSLRQRR